MSINPLAAWRAWRERRAAEAERRLIYSAVNLPAGTYVRAPDGSWHATDHPDPTRVSVTVTRPASERPNDGQA